jgi:hypothetical protein
MSRVTFNKGLKTASENFTTWGRALSGGNFLKEGNFEVCFYYEYNICGRLIIKKGATLQVKYLLGPPHYFTFALFILQYLKKNQF